MDETTSYMKTEKLLQRNVACPFWNIKKSFIRWSKQSILPYFPRAETIICSNKIENSNEEKLRLYLHGQLCHPSLSVPTL